MLDMFGLTCVPALSQRSSSPRLAWPAMFANVEHVYMHVEQRFYRCRPQCDLGGPRGFIFVKFGGDEILLSVDANHTIDQVKAEIAAQFGIPSDEQHHRYVHYPAVRRPSRSVIFLDENMMYVRHLIGAGVLKEGFSFRLFVTRMAANTHSDDPVGRGFVEIGAVAPAKSQSASSVSDGGSRRHADGGASIDAPAPTRRRLFFKQPPPL